MNKLQMQKAENTPSLTEADERLAKYMARLQWISIEMQKVVTLVRAGSLSEAVLHQTNIIEKQSKWLKGESLNSRKAETDEL